jgi:hypothetical protein
MTAAGPKRIFILSEPNSGMEDATRAGGRGQGRRRGREELESAAARPGTAAPALPAVRPGRRGVRGASVASLVFLAGPGGSRQGWLNLGWAPNSRRISGSERCRAWLSRVLPLRVLVASGPGAPGDAGSRTCGNPRLGDPAAAFRSDRRCRRSFGVSFTKTLAESPEASILAYPTPRDRRLKGDSSRGWLPCFPRKGYFFFFFRGRSTGRTVSMRSATPGLWGNRVQPCTWAEVKEARAPPSRPCPWFTRADKGAAGEAAGLKVGPSFDFTTNRHSLAVGTCPGCRGRSRQPWSRLKASAGAAPGGHGQLGQEEAGLAVWLLRELRFGAAWRFLHPPADFPPSQYKTHTHTHTHCVNTVFGHRSRRVNKHEGWG